MNVNYRVSRDFVSCPDPILDEFANAVIIALTGNAAFPDLPVAVKDLTDLNTTFRNAIAAAASGGRQQTAIKDKARDAVIDALRKNAGYVQIIASKNLDVLLSSGFSPASTNRAQAPLDAPVIVELSNLASKQLLLRLTSVDNAKSYHVQQSVNGNGGWQEAGIFTQARRIVLDNLTPGTTYNVRARAIGGSTGSSDWSGSQSQIST